METFKTSTKLDNFFKRLSTADKRVLFLDYDGTLAEFKKDRDKAFPYPGVKERLEKLAASEHTKLVIISGRSLKDLKKLLNLNYYPYLIGGHGTEIQQADSGNIELKIDEIARDGLLQAQMWTIEAGLNDYCERKLTGIAYHWRGLSEEKRTEIQEKVFAKWNENASRYNLELHEFDGGIEVRSANMNKGIAVRNVLNGHDDSAVVAYLGDDYTDEQAFEQLRNGALKVLVRRETRPTKADIHLVPPDEMIEFLDRWIGAEKTS